MLAFAATLTACAPQDDASPLANPGPARAGQTGQSFTFDGTGSAADAWSWALVQAPPGSALGSGDLAVGELAFADGPWPELTPDAEGVYVLELRACTQAGACAVGHTLALVGVQAVQSFTQHRSFVIGRVLHDNDPWEFRGFGGKVLHDDDPWEFRGFVSNKPPVALASVWQGMRAGDAVLLQGGQSYDPEGEALGFRWAFTVLPADSALSSGDLVGSTDSAASFTPDVDGVYGLRLTVSDGQRRSSADVTLTRGDGS